MTQHLAGGCGETLVFPPMPERLSYVRVPERLRRFGTCADDLYLDFQSPRAPLTTAILETCAVDADGQPFCHPFAEALELGKRLECLLALAMIDQPQRELTLTCPFVECAQQMELELDLNELFDLQHQAEVAATVALETSPALRRPTALDLKLWGSTVYSSETDAREALLHLLLLDRYEHERAEPILTRWPQLSEALADADPLIDFAISTHCPDCGRASRHGFDLEGFALDELAAARSQLMGEIHVLASRYHWSEEAILKLPRWRRRAYLDLIQAESNADESQGWIS